MIPILFEYNATDFTTHGIGDLIDATACETEMNDEGEYELSLVYPISGPLINELTIGRIIYVKANPWQSNQQFRIYGYEKEIGGKLTVNAQHISYDLANLPAKKFKSSTSATCNTVLANLKTNMMDISGLSKSKFTFYSNVSGTAQTQDGYYELDTPSSARAAILDGDDSIKGVFGGDLVLDNYSISLLATGGADRGVYIDYGVDLIDLNQEENISEMVTGVLPYFRYTQENTDDELVTYGSIQYASGTFRNHKVSPLDLTEYFPNQAEHTSPTAAQLNSKAQQWIAAEPNFGEPEVNLTLNYAQLGQDVRLHDAVTVRFIKMGIDVKAKVTSYKYDVLNERPKEVQVGKTKKSVLFSLEDASRLRKGLLPPARIKDKSLTSDKYADSSVGSAAIGTGSVGSSKIAGGAVTNSKVADNAIDTKNIVDSAIKYNKIADKAVIEGKLNDAAVSERTIVSSAVSYAKLAGGSVDTNKFTSAMQVTWSDILAAQAVFAQVISASGAVSCNSLVLNGTTCGISTILDGNGNPRNVVMPVW